MNPLLDILRKNRRAKKRHATMKMESFTGNQGYCKKRPSSGGLLDGDTGPRGRIFVPRQGSTTGSLMHERQGTQNVHWHAPATLAREPSFAAQMSNANDPNETVLTLVRLSMSPVAASLPLLPDATALLGVIAAEPLD